MGDRNRSPLLRRTAPLSEVTPKYLERNHSSNVSTHDDPQRRRLNPLLNGVLSAAAFAVIFVTRVDAQSISASRSNKEISETLHSSILHEDRSIQIFLPDSYTFFLEADDTAKLYIGDKLLMAIDASVDKQTSSFSHPW